jgi:hypothetical protein
MGGVKYTTEGRGEYGFVPDATPKTCWYSIQKYQKALIWLLLLSEFPSYVSFLSAEYVIAELKRT